ncbi:hypothetical protein RRG08_033312 [Elysia crispata]|uniref:Uncharacterized protein n=1 Tax=Elysia crispata TaxID=231223 RepID=A0AAE1CJ00_9GAST|nr:hypothetical protein RRG08_033312 [Elysia crispata]
MILVRNIEAEEFEIHTDQNAEIRGITLAVDNSQPLISPSPQTKSYKQSLQAIKTQKEKVLTFKWRLP